MQQAVVKVPAAAAKAAQQFLEPVFQHLKFPAYYSRLKALIGLGHQGVKSRLVRVRRQGQLFLQGKDLFQIRCKYSKVLGFPGLLPGKHSLRPNQVVLPQQVLGHQPQSPILIQEEADNAPFHRSITGGFCKILGQFPGLSRLEQPRFTGGHQGLHLLPVGCALFRQQPPLVQLK